jgi:hypothetical protein
VKAAIVSVDFQNDFAMPGGFHYRPRACVEFIQETLRPHLVNRGLRIAEIISDYREPRPDLPPKADPSCQPGEWGYESAIEADVKDPRQWIKCLNSPIWIRENIGDPARPPGSPYSEPSSFTRWAYTVVGWPEEVMVVLIGLTLDCCVLCNSSGIPVPGLRCSSAQRGRRHLWRHRGGKGNSPGKCGAKLGEAPDVRRTGGTSSQRSGGPLIGTDSLGAGGPLHRQRRTQIHISPLRWLPRQECKPEVSGDG